MDKATKQRLIDDLESLESRLNSIVFSDPERYKSFLSRAHDLEEKLIGISELELESHIVEITRELSLLESDFDFYMEGSDISTTEHFTSGEEIETGKSKLRKYKFDLYSSIIDDLNKLNFIDIYAVKKLKLKFEQDKENEEIGFTPFEIDALSEQFAKLFLEYQKKYLKQKGTFPIDEIEKYTTLEEYHEALNSNLHSISTNPNLSALDKIELEKLYREKNLETLLSDSNLWKILTGLNIKPTENEVSQMLSKEIPEEKTDIHTEKNKSEAQETALALTKKKTSKKDVILTLEIPNRFFKKGKSHLKQVKVKVDEYGQIDVRKYSEYIVAAVIPAGIEQIPILTFNKCHKLRSVQLPDSLKRIADSAFQDCTSLESINLNIPHLHEIGSNAFYNCSSLEELHLPDSLTQIGTYCFHGSSQLKKVKLPTRLNSLGPSAFSNCSGLEEFICSELLEVIPKGCFHNCTNLKEITFGCALEKIDDSAFANCENLEIPSFPFGLEYIGNNAFENCQMIGDLKFPYSLTHIGQKAFFNCNLTTRRINLPSKKLEYLGRESFGNNPNLEHIYMPETIEHISDPFGKIYNPKVEIHIPHNPSGAFYTPLAIPDSKKGEVITGSQFKQRIKEFIFKERSESAKRISADENSLKVLAALDEDEFVL